MSRIGDFLRRLSRPRPASADWTTDDAWDRDPITSRDSGKYGESFGADHGGKLGETLGSHDAGASAADDGGADDGGDSDGGGDD